MRTAIFDRIGKSAVLGLALFGMLALPAIGEDEGPERFTANLISTTPGVSGTTRMDITVDRWTTEEERAKLVDALGEGEQFSMVHALRELDQVGNARLQNRTARNLHYSRQFMEGETRHILLATDRPIGMQEAARNTRTLDNNISIIHLELDAKGRGTGTFMAGAELEFDQETGKLTITHASMNPVRMTRVRSRN